MCRRVVVLVEAVEVRRPRKCCSWARGFFVTRPPPCVPTIDRERCASRCAACGVERAESGPLLPLPLCTGRTWGGGETERTDPTARVPVSKLKAALESGAPEISQRRRFFDRREGVGPLGGDGGRKKGRAEGWKCQRKTHTHRDQEKPTTHTDRPAHAIARIRINRLLFGELVILFSGRRTRLMERSGKNEENETADPLVGQLNGAPPHGRFYVIQRREVSLRLLFSH